MHSEASVSDLPIRWPDLRKAKLTLLKTTSSGSPSLRNIEISCIISQMADYTQVYSFMGSSIYSYTKNDVHMCMQCICVILVSIDVCILYACLYGYLYIFSMFIMHPGTFNFYPYSSATAYF